MTRLRNGVSLLALTLALVACTGSSNQGEPPSTAGDVDLQRYQGTWYELARLPMFFQRKCKQSEAHYQLQADGTMAVTNRCRTADGETIEARGQASAQVEGRTDKLWVRFDNWFSKLLPDVARGEYWVLYLDSDYRTALVGHPNREYLWLLSRQAQVPEVTQALMLEQARLRGYDTAELIWRAADDEMPAKP
ncbi:lipocalin family protein [Pseudomonas borbori]